MNPSSARKRLQGIWYHMHARCGNPEAINYNYYGGRGITVSKEWWNFETFYSWALASNYEEEKWLDRIDNNGNYGPDNCRWSTPQESANNRSSTKFITAWGERKSLFEWTQDSRCNINYAGLKQRLNRGWSPEEALSMVACKRASGVGWIREKELCL